jgi:uncharacterized membrane protein (UPF0127 family)
LYFLLFKSPVVGTKLVSDPTVEVEDEEAQANKGMVVDRKLKPETGFLYAVNRKRLRSNVRRQILTNVLVQAFLYFKWQKIKWFCFVAIFYHVRIFEACKTI